MVFQRTDIRELHNQQTVPVVDPEVGSVEPLTLWKISTDSSVILEEVKKTFQPEFRNRLNKIVVFHGMDDSMASRVVDKKLKELGTLLEAKKIVFEVEQAARELIKNHGISQMYGAREVDRVIRNEIKPLFVDEILFGKLKKGGKLVLSARDDQFVIRATKKS